MMLRPSATRYDSQRFVLDTSPSGCVPDAPLCNVAGRVPGACSVAFAILCKRPGSLLDPSKDKSHKYSLFPSLSFVSFSLCATRHTPTSFYFLSSELALQARLVRIAERRKNACVQHLSYDDTYLLKHTLKRSEKLIQPLNENFLHASTLARPLVHASMLACTTSEQTKSKQACTPLCCGLDPLPPAGGTLHFLYGSLQAFRDVKKMLFTKPLTHPLDSAVVSAVGSASALVLSRADLTEVKTDEVKGSIFSLWKSDETWPFLGWALFRLGNAVMVGRLLGKHTLQRKGTSRAMGHEISISCPLRYMLCCFSWLCKPVHGSFLFFSVLDSFLQEVNAIAKIHVVNAGVDTFVVNAYYLDEHDQPLRRRELDPSFADLLNDWKQHAQNESKPYPTDFSFRGAQLLMQPNGAGRGQWQWMLKTPDITLYISRGLWNGIASVRLNSEFLWARPSLSEALIDVQALLYDVFDQEILHLQPSSIDLCADIAGWDDVETLNKKRHFVSHSRKRRHDSETDPAEGLKATDHSYGLHDTGFDFSSRGPMSVTIYDKTRYIQQDGKKWFLEIWRLHEWDQEKEPSVWRVEAKLKREVLRDIEWLDQHGIEDAYQIEDLLPMLWAYAVGHVGGGNDGLPDGWLRCVRPGKDSNRARWTNHPAWDVVQVAYTQDMERPEHFGNIIRKAKEEHNIEKALSAILGYATSLSAWLGGALASPDADLSIFLHWLAENGQDHLEKKDRDFALEVLKKRVKIGKQVLAPMSSHTA